MKQKYSNYIELVKDLQKYGTKSSPREMGVIEVFNVVYQYTIEGVDGIVPMLLASGRCMPVPFNLYEVLWILAGSRTVHDLSLYNSRMKMFSDDGQKFNAPYGYRLKHHFDGVDQIAELIKLLGRPMNFDSRRGAMMIWDVRDLGKDSKDIPCNDFFMVKLRGDTMKFTICNRSNDVHWGLPTNVVQFSNIAKVIFTSLKARYTDLKRIEMTHYIDNLHMYTSENERPVFIDEFFSDNLCMESMFVSEDDEFAVQDKNLDNLNMRLPELIGNRYTNMFFNKNSKGILLYKDFKTASADFYNYVQSFDLESIQLYKTTTSPDLYYEELNNLLVYFYEQMRHRILTNTELFHMDILSRHNKMSLPIYLNRQQGLWCQYYLVFELYRAFKQGVSFGKFFELKQQHFGNKRMRSDYMIGCFVYFSKIILKRIATNKDTEVDVQNLRFMCDAVTNKMNELYTENLLTEVHTAFFYQQVLKFN